MKFKRSGIIYLVFLFLGIVGARGDSFQLDETRSPYPFKVFKFCDAAGIAYFEKGGFQFSVGRKPLFGKLGHSHWNYKAVKSSTTGIDSTNRTIWVKTEYLMKDMETPVSEIETRYQRLDGTNAIVRSFVTFKGKCEQSPAQYFTFPFPTMSPTFVVEIVQANGQSKTFKPKSQELFYLKTDPYFKDAKKVIFKDGGFHLEIVPGKDSSLWVSDSRVTSDDNPGSVIATIFKFPLQPRKAGDTLALESKVLLKSSP